VDELLLGLDIGTSSSKAVLASADGTLVDAVEKRHDVSLPRPGWVEHDASSVWWADIQAFIARFDERQRAAVRGVCVSGIGPCLLPIGAKEEPLRPAILYGVDTRATAEAEELTELYGVELIVSVGGSPLTSQALGPKLLWLRRHEPKIWASTRRLVMASSFAVLRFTGEYVLDHHSASQCNPLYDLGLSNWRAAWAGEVAPGLELLRLLWPGEVAGKLSDEAAEETGLPPGVPVAAGTIDAWAEAFGAGVVAEGDTMLSYGRTMFIVHVAPQAVPDPHLWLTAGCSAPKPDGRRRDGDFRRAHQLVARHRRRPSLRAAPTRGRRGPARLRRLGSPTVLRRRTDTTVRPIGPRGHPRLDAAPWSWPPLPGVPRSHRVRRAPYLEIIQAAGGDPRRLVAVGGGTRGGLWAQVVSDITGREQDLPSPSIGASYGDAHPCRDRSRPSATRCALGKGSRDRPPQRRLAATLRPAIPGLPTALSRDQGPRP
jgi:xylulokinase